VRVDRLVDTNQLTGVIQLLDPGAHVLVSHATKDIPGRHRSLRAGD
jgi:hypothetical protein